MKRTFTLAFVAAATFAAAAPAQAALSPVDPATNCVVSQVNPTADNCTGWYSGNLNGQGAFSQDVLDALKLLDPTITSYTSLAYLPSLTGTNTIDFGVGMSGKTIIGIHRGGAGEFRKDGTAFFIWNNLEPTAKFTDTIAGISNATLYVTTFSQVPEPGTWMLMIAGICLMGWQLRRRRQTVKVSYA